MTVFTSAGLWSLSWFAWCRTHSCNILT